MQERTIFSANSVGATEYAHAKEYSWMPSLHHCKNYSNMLNTKNLRSKTIEHLEEIIGVNLHTLGLDIEF